MLKDGAVAWEVKDFLVQQDRCEEVTIEGKSYPGKASPDYKVSSSFHRTRYTGPHSAVGNLSDYKCASDCRSRGREFDPSLVPYSRGD